MLDIIIFIIFIWITSFLGNFIIDALILEKGPKDKYEMIFILCPVINTLYFIKSIIYLIIKLIIWIIKYNYKSIIRFNLKDFIKEFFKYNN